ncbi:MAG TPA: UDP-4-amino-4,6-dideoxy-N-acetyl-beta-L-altrosamine N-acetyltransferase [Caulobacteraceae bacterium]|jgi:UDP-4-amino-4,6-dideoxy-N-acetyl-beta-L-altrosamine N-acetyltransferase|nr:UDP-4-amino-4,6-dideoxy-N-acetyl-beta-L-altrosamine N-acetyltransferase [Caulobacteraceae bacterium]
MIDLRPLKDEDSERLFRWRREPEVDRWMSDLPAATADEHGRWFDDFRADPDRGGWIITADDQPAGFLTLTGVISRHRRASWGWYIGEADARGRGAGRAAQALGLDLAFDELGLEKVSAEVLADNDVALKAQAAAGFRREGYLREHIVKDGRRRDVVLLGILADEWRARREPLRRSLSVAHLIAA